MTTLDLTLRDVAEADLAALFEFQQDPEANHMAGFTVEDPSDRSAFTARWNRILADPSVTSQVIVESREVVGSVQSFEEDGRPEVTYWIAREHWGKGIATRALSEFLRRVHRTRPVYARVAKDNAGSRRVLEKCGFEIVGETTGFANARGEEIEELLLKLGPSRG